MSVKVNPSIVPMTNVASDDYASSRSTGTRHSLQLTSSVEFRLAFCFASLRERIFPVLTSKLCESMFGLRDGRWISDDKSVLGENTA